MTQASFSGGDAQASASSSFEDPTLREILMPCFSAAVLSSERIELMVMPFLPMT